MDYFRTSEKTEKVDSALLKVQMELQPVTKNKENPYFKSKYADFSSMIEQVRPLLNKHGISLSQWPVHSSTDDNVHLVTRLACEGEWILCECSSPALKRDPQAVGSVISYLKRYSLEAAVGVATEDDDANRASSPTHQLATPQIPQSTDQDFPFEDKTSALAEYVIPLGKNKGKKLREISVNALRGYPKWRKDQAAKGENLNGIALQMCERAEEYLNEIGPGLEG